MNSEIGYKNLCDLIKKYGSDINFNEADTRAKIIDVVLKDVLFWNEENIKRETHSESGYSDYQLMIDEYPILVIEAKKQGQHFEIPVNKKHRNYIIDGSISKDKNLFSAIIQVRNYCDDIGCKFAAIFNGHQLGIFSAISVGKSWKKGKIILFNSLGDIENNFNLFWNILSYESVKAGSLSEYLERNKQDIRYYKVINEIRQTNGFYARNSLYVYLRPITEFIFSELLDKARTEILKECYVYGRSNYPLTFEMEKYFVDKIPHHLKNLEVKENIETENDAGDFQKKFVKFKSSENGNLVVLIGGIGAGKSTFISRFFRVILNDDDNLIYFYIDFRGSLPTSTEIEPFIYDRISNIWNNEYIDKYAKKLSECGINPLIQPSKEDILQKINFLKTQNKVVALIIDNVDQHTTDYQEDLFITANHITNTLKTSTIIALREETYMISGRIGVFDAYTVPKFHISSPNFLNMVKKRIDYTISIFEKSNNTDLFGDIPKEIKESIITFFNILKDSLKKENMQSQKIIKLIDSITVGNMREGLDLFNNFLVSGNTNTQEIFEIYKQSKSYQIAYHQFVKSIMLGEHEYYSQRNSKILNLFDFDDSIGNSHFNLFRILNYLNSRSNKRTDIGVGYVTLNKVFFTAEKVNILHNVMEDALIRLINFGLVELDTQSKSTLDNASHIKITNSGKYYLFNLIYEFVYLHQVSIDTPISDREIMMSIKCDIDRKGFKNILNRVKSFVNYLIVEENNEFKQHPEYINNEFSKFRVSTLFERKTLRNIDKINQRYTR